MPNAEQRADLRRRTVLGAALGGAVVALTGCGIRLERDAPHIPGIKTQGPPADQAVLRTLLTQVEATITAATLSSSSWAKSLAHIHRAQRSRLIQVMATQGMTPAPTPTAPASTGTASPPAHLPLAAEEQHLAVRIGSLSAVSARNLPMAAAIGVTHSAAAQVLGKTVDIAGGAVPKTAEAAAILPSLQAAVYAFEVIVAKTPLHSRNQAEATLEALRPTRSAWEAALGDRAPLQPDGYALPVQPTTTAARTQLALRVLTDLIDACAGQVAATRGDRPSFLGLTILWSDATAQLWRWGDAPAPFPGLVA
jgi:hypothetical protein